LSSRGKWKKLHEQPRFGDVVLVADYNTPLRTTETLVECG
ncbi:hypothetical protein T4A_11107, partial [Trichinella pseudospiralis]